MKKYQNQIWLTKKYHKEGLSIRQIAILCDCSQQLIYIWMQRFGIERRDYHQPKSEEHKKKLKKLLLGYKQTEKWKKNMSEALKKRVYTEEHRQKIGDANRKRIGENHPLWQGGKSFEPYPAEFNIQLKQRIRERDNNQCQLCYTDRNERAFECHHIDGDKKNSSDLNLITMCGRCHKKMLKLGEALVDYFRYKAWVNENLIKETLVDKCYF